MNDADLRISTAGGSVVYSESTATGTAFQVGAAANPIRRRPSPAALERAVYAHIRAVRALGRTRINTSEIADALGVNVGRVAEVLVRLQSKGVKVSR